MNLSRVLIIGALGTAMLVTTAATAGAQNNTASDVLTAAQLKELAATAKTPADHMKLSRHFAALTVRYDVEAINHDGVAEAHRKAPNASESKRPGAPDTALHCERLAQLARESAKESRALATAHERMAAGAK